MHPRLENTPPRTSNKWDFFLHVHTLLYLIKGRLCMSNVLNKHFFFLQTYKKQRGQQELKRMWEKFKTHVEVYHPWPL